MKLSFLQVVFFLLIALSAFCADGLSQMQGEDVDSYLNRLQVEGKKGNGEAFYILGKIYDEGTLVKKDPSVALKWYESSAKCSYRKGLFSLAYAYMMGKTVPQNYELARVYYIKAANAGSAAAAYTLGLIYDDGMGVAKDKKEAVQWFEKSYALGNLDERVSVGSYYMLSLGDPEYVGCGVKILEDAAAQDSTRAASLLGTCYYIQPATYDREKAFYYLDKAAAKGDRDALCVLGQMYLRGDAKGGKDEKKGLASLRASADKGDSEAMAILGAYYLARKRDTKGGLEKGLAYLEKGAALDSPTAQYELGLLYTSGTYVDKDEARGIALLEKSAAGGDDRAQLEMATHYGQGQGVPLDFDRMKALLEASAAQGNLEAKGLLKKLSAVGEARAAVATPSTALGNPVPAASPSAAQETARKQGEPVPNAPAAATTSDAVPAATGSAP